MWKNNSGLIQKKERFTLYVIDLDWLKKEVWEIYGWKLVSFDKLIISILEETEENFIKFLKNFIKENNFYLVEHWKQKRLSIITRLEKLLDVEGISENFEFYKWLSNRILVLKRKEHFFRRKIRSSC